MGKTIAAFWLALMACAGTAAADDEAEAAIGDTRLTAGDDVQIDQPVKGSAFAAGRRVVVSAQIGRNLYMAGGNIRIASGALVDGSASLAGGSIEVDGGIGAFTMRAWKGFRRDTEERPAPA